MTSVLICFNLGQSLDEQILQITYWLNYLNSSLILSPLSSIPKWNVILVGVRADEQQDFSLTQDPLLISAWKKKWSKIPIVSKVFAVSSLKSPESVQHLLQFVEEECSHIFDNHTAQIPTSYQHFLSKLQDISKQYPIIHWKDLHSNFGSEIKGGEAGFKTMLQYIKSIGRIVWLPTGFVFTDPTIAPKIAAKFVSPKGVRLALLKKETDKVQILDETEIGCLLDIDTSDNER
jgi:hypothetical protein